MAEADDPAIVASHASHKGGVTALQFRPHMKHLVSGGADGTVMMWSLYNRSSFRRSVARPYRFQGHQAAVCAVAVSPLDTVVATGSKDKTVRLWLPTIEGRSTMIKGHCGPVRTVAFSPDGERLLTGSDDKTLKGWDVGSEKFLFTLSGHLNWVRSGEFNDDGRLIVSGSDDKTICLWDSERHYCIHQFTEIIGMVACTRFHPDGHCIGSCGSDQCIQIWDIRCKMLIQHYTVTEGWVHSLCFHPSGDFMISTCDDATLRVWDLREGRMLYMLRGHEGPTTCAEFSKTGEYFASGSSDEHVMIWQSNFSDSCCTHPGPLAMTLYTTHSDIKCSNVPSCQNETCEHDSQMEEDFQSDVPVNDNGIIRQPPKLSKIHKTSKGDKFMESSNNGITTKAQLYNTKQCEDMIEYSYGLDNELGTFETTLKHIVNQLDVLTQTIVLFEERLSQTEDKLVTFGNKGLAINEYHAP